MENCVSDPLSNLRTLSASKIKTFQTCNRQYKYRYVDRVQSEKTQSLALGSAVHKAVEKIYKDRSLARDRTQVVLACYNEQVLENELPFDARAMKDAVKMIDLYDFDRRDPRELELEFTFAFPNQAHPLAYINGYLDQFYDEGFLDMKSNKYRPKQFVLDNDLQFILYAWAFKEITGYDPQLKTWLHLRTGEEFDADVVGKLDLAQREIEKILEAEVTGIYDKHTGEWCGWCPYQEECLGRKYT